jgi:glycosyltransferase involved in cell wall biosynthesis
MSDENIKVSVVIPCLNEEKTIAETIENIKEGLSIAKVNGEILIADSSTDKSPEIAKNLGARVLTLPKRGLGRAYIDSIPHIKGKYVVMGDADCTYDFREINKFVEKLDQGNEYVMGTRIKGFIEEGAMPALHRYFGNPLTTWILNRLLGTNYSDIHSGLRAMTLNALKKIDLQSQSWEYASEMVVKASLLKLKSTEVPIHFYKDKEGRESHHKRMGWFSPWYAGWINLKVMLLHVPEQMIIKPGLFFFLLGLLLILMQVMGPVSIGGITFSIGTMMLGLTLSVLGFSSIQMGMLVKLFTNLNKYVDNKKTNSFADSFTYTKGMIIGFSMFLLGAVLASTLVMQWLSHGYKLFFVPWHVILGLLIIILGIQTILFNLVFQAFILSREKES